MPGNYQNTNYHGAAVSTEFARALQDQPIGRELLRFDPQGDHQLMQIRLPERGRYTPGEDGQADPALEGMEFNIRINMNYLVRGMARACMDQDGNIDPNKLNRLSELGMKLSRGQRGGEESFREFVDLLDVPEERRPEFEAFLRANHVGASGVGSPLLFYDNSPIEKMVSEIDTHLLPYQGAVNGELGPEAKRFAERYREQFETTMQSFREMAEMDPETETRILYPMDCLSFRILTNHFVRQNNAYRRAHGLDEYQVDGFQLDMRDQEKTAKQEGKHLAFGVHAFLAADVNLRLPDENGVLRNQKYTLSLESTAPPTGELFQRPEVVPTGVGVFESKEAIKAYHRGKNLVNVKDYELFSTVREHVPTRKRGAVIPTVKAPQERSYRRYCYNHTGAAVNKIPDERLPEYAAKVTAAAMLQNRQGDFDLKALRHAAEVLQKSPNFIAAVRNAGPNKLRDALHNGRVSDLVELTVGGRERYALSSQGKTRLAQMGAAMKRNSKSPEWDSLKTALENPEAADSGAVFDAAEKFLKGKKSVRRRQEDRDAVDLAVSAVAVAARDGDAVAKKRAQILVNRINQVRGTKPGEPNHVDLKDYPKAYGSFQPKAPERGPEAPQRQPAAEKRGTAPTAGPAS